MSDRRAAMTTSSARTSPSGLDIIGSAHRRRSLRAPVRVLTALFTALSLMAAVDPGWATATTVAHLSATASPTTVLTRGTVVVAGTVAPRGSGVVTLQRYVSGHWSQ